MPGRPREFDRDEALVAAMRLFWRNGYQATSMNELCEVMQIKSPSLYAAFGSKEDLYLAAVERYGSTIGLELWGGLDRARNARSGVEEVLTTAAGILAGRADAPRGCMLMLAALSDEWPEAIGLAVRAIRDSVRKRLKKRFAGAVKEGELPGTTDVDGLSRFVLAVFQGMAVQARDGASRSELTKIAVLAIDAFPWREAR